MIADNAPLYRIAHRLRRSLSSVRTKMNKLDLHVRSDGDLRSGRATLRTEALRASQQKSPAAVKQPGQLLVAVLGAEPVS